MKCLNLGFRECEACGALLSRRRWPGGLLEKPDRFLRRRFCDHACKSRGYLLPTKSKACRHCTEPLSRKQWKSGRWETRREFRRRIFCDNACKRAWLDDPENSAEYGRRMAKFSARVNREALRRPRKAAIEKRGKRTRCEWCSCRPAATNDVVCAQCLPIIAERLAA